MQLAEIATLLEASPDYLVARRFQPRDTYLPAWVRPEGAWIVEPPPLSRGVFVDLETTGLDVERDRIIELGLTPFTFNREGYVYDVLEPYAAYDDPGIPIPLEVQALTGITDGMVRGQHIDAERVFAELERADLTIAHNAAFDRPILERYFLTTRPGWWACSQRDVPWYRTGSRSTVLEYLLLQHCREFYDAHRAVDDTLVGLHVLASVRIDDRPALWHLLEAARTPTIRITAIDAPFPDTPTVKARRVNDRKYKWNPGDRGRKGWYIDLPPALVDAEVEWLMVEVYHGRVEARHAIAITRFNGRDRYSLRV